jgi:hypothetical protein
VDATEAGEAPKVETALAVAEGAVYATMLIFSTAIAVEDKYAVTANPEESLARRSAWQIDA